jgi:hypothetical protein
MFPNNMEFFVREKEAERLADMKHIRLTSHLKSRPQLVRHQLGRIIHWAGIQLVNWGQKLQVQATPAVSQTSEQSLS